MPNPVPSLFRMGTPEETLRAYWAVVEASPDLIYRADERGIIEAVSPSSRSVLGYAPGELTGRNIAELLTDWAGNKNAIAVAFEMQNGQKRAGRFEAEVWHKDGRRVMLGVSKTCAPGPDGRLRHYGVARDITRERAMEDELRGKEQQLRTIFESAREAIFMKDVHGRYVTANPATARVLNRPLSDFVGKLPREAFAPEEAARIEEEDRRALAGERVHRETHLTIDGVRRTFLITKTPLTGADGRVTGICAVAYDLTEWKAAQERLRQAEKMEAIAELAAGITHDFNNILTGILGHAEMIKEMSPPASDIHDSANTIVESAFRAARLNHQIVAFARQGRPPRQVIDLRSLLEELGARARATLPADVEVHLSLCPEPLPVRADAAQVEQAFLHLAQNAREAMPAGGTLAVSARILHADAGFTDQHPGSAPIPYVVVSFRDTGRGIRPEHLGHVFEPFFTTKEPGEGSGLGLAVVYGCLRNHGGFVEASSEARRGAQFDCYFPLQPEAAEAEPAPPTAQVPARVLIVDDDDDIRRLAAQTLSQLGHAVRCARDGREALACYSVCWREIDLVVLDLVMRHVGGAECLRRMSEINPQVRALITTAYARSADAEGLARATGAAFLAKPYRQGDLAAAVTRALAPS